MNSFRTTNNKSVISTLFTISSVLVVVIYIVHMIAPSLVPSIVYRVMTPFVRANKSDMRIPPSLDIVARENQELRNLLGRTTDFSIQTQWAPVVLRAPNIHETIVIDIGTDSDVMIGARVFDGKLIGIGTVASIIGRYATVNLYSMPGRSFEVLIASTTATAYGKGGGNFYIDLPRNISVAVGDSLSVTGIIPTVVATVEAVIMDPTAPFVRLIARLPVNIRTLTYVVVER